MELNWIETGKIVLFGSNNKDFRNHMKDKLYRFPQNAVKCLTDYSKLDL